MCRNQNIGFTLLELLVVVSLISLLLAILLPAMSAGRHAAFDLKCKAQLRIVTLEFRDFADESGVGRRGDSNQIGPNRFRIEDFQESIYGIDEFWRGVEAERAPLDGSEQPMMCPTASSRLERRRGMPCSSGAVGPQKNVSIAFNKRLETRTRYINGNPFSASAYPSRKILDHPDVPLLFDVDGEEAVNQGKPPYYAAPPIHDDAVVDIYEPGQFWFPSFRHRGRLNVGFVGGYVLSSTNPTAEPWWRWGYQPDP